MVAFLGEIAAKIDKIINVAREKRVQRANPGD